MYGVYAHGKFIIMTFTEMLNPITFAQFAWDLIVDRAELKLRGDFPQAKRTVAFRNFPGIFLQTLGSGIPNQDPFGIDLFRCLKSSTG